ncbi:MAG: signal peptidase II [Alphaproteobacteria bacterium]|nr:signal peptidase II [Alphaproteobacteria bacterium]
MILKKYLSIAAIALVVLILDQWTKHLIVTSAVNEVTFMPIMRMFNLVLVHNRGISFGMFSDLHRSEFIFTAIACLISVTLLVWVRKSALLIMPVGTGLIIGGAFGNVVDRLRYGYVIDFLDFHLGEYHWPAFNVADSVIFIGVTLLCFGSVLEDYRLKKDTFKKREQ